jgi:hypothetical protein
MAVKDDKGLTIHGESGEGDEYRQKRLKNADPVAIYAGRKTKKYIGGGAGTRCTMVDFKLLRSLLNN